MYQILMRNNKTGFLFLFFFLLSWGVFGQSKKGRIYGKAAVVCAHPEAARVGEEVLRKGGNAADAAFAVHFALAVVYPSAGNLGGGGFALYRSHAGEYDFVDFRETAPQKSSRNMYLDKQGNPIPGKSTDTHAAAGVPGSVAGIFDLHDRYGSVSKNMLLYPAIRLAKYGFPITAIQAEEFNKYAAVFQERNPTNTYLRKSGDWKEGDTLIQEDLAKVLAALDYPAGKKGFYEGWVADLLVKEMKRGKGLITKKDLKNYRSVWRTPVSGTYRGLKVVSAPPPSAGGVALLQMLALAENVDFSDFSLKSFNDVFYTSEIEKLAYADRAKFMGDPDFFAVPVDSLLDSAYLAKRWKQITPHTPTPSAQILPGHFNLKEKENTTHFSIVDTFGNAVSLTTTINDHYGSKIFVTGVGFLLNNEMDDFSVKPGVPNMYGLVGSKANEVAAKKRMLSSMTPTMVEKDGKLFMVLGTPGGSTITTTVFRNIINVVDFGLSLNASVGIKRYHHQWLPDYIFHEKGAFPDVLEEELKKSGFILKERENIGRADCILVLPDGRLEAAPDPRGDDVCAGW